MKPPEIVVGVDDSLASRAAVRWAAAEARRRNIGLVVMHSYDWRVIGARSPVGGGYADAVRARAEEVVEVAIAQAREAVPAVTVRGEVVLGAAGPVLVQSSAEAPMVVVGSRGRGGFASLLLGSVSHQVATHAAGPVVVVRGREDIVGGPVVVGVDGSASGNHALGEAFQEAQARDTSLVAVRVYSPRRLAPGPVVPEDKAERRAIEHDLLAQDLAPWKEKYPDVDTEAMVIDGHAAEVLIGVSATAQLVVVGTRGHGGFVGLLLGSVGQQVIHHAECPVLIVRSQDREAAA
jgi:nucleotide-binding universal stress UspA family protein